MPIDRIAQKLKSEGVILAIIPFIGSLTAFAFETGYLTFYDVPYDVISIGLYRIVTSALWLSIVIAIVWVFIARIIAITLSPNNAIKNAFLFVVLIGISIFIILKTEFKKEMLWAMAAPLLFSALSLFSWCISENGPIGKKFPAPIAEAVKDGQAIANNAKRIADFYIGPFMLTSIVLVLVSIVGYWTAKLSVKNWVMDDKPTYVLVRKYDEAYIFKEYDPKTMKIADRVQIIELSEAKAMTLRHVVLKGLTSKFGNYDEHKKEK